MTQISLYDPRAHHIIDTIATSTLSSVRIHATSKVRPETGLAEWITDVVDGGTRDIPLDVPNPPHDDLIDLFADLADTVIDWDLVTAGEEDTPELREWHRYQVGQVLLFAWNIVQCRTSGHSWVSMAAHDIPGVAGGLVHSAIEYIVDSKLTHHEETS